MTDKRTFHVRSLELDAGLDVDDDAGEVSGMIVPFSRPARIVEPNEAGDLEFYREQFAPGSLTAQSQHEAKRRDPWAWLPLYFSHTESLSNHIGAAKAVHQREDGIYATFELLPDTNLAKIKRLLSKSAGYFSVKFRELGQPIVEGDLVTRTSVMVQHVAAVGLPAYEEARVMAVRDGEQFEPFKVETPHLDELRASFPELFETT